MAPLPLTRPIPWAADPHRDANWRMQLNMLRLIDPLIDAHESAGDPRALSEALEVCLDWHHFHLEARAPNPRAWVDMATGLRTLRIAYLSDRIRQAAVVPAAVQCDAMAAMLFSHWRRIVTPGFMRFSNHTIWDLHGLEALVRLALPAADPRRAAWREAIGARLGHLVACQFGPDGLHLENSPQYHFVAAAMFGTLEASGWYDDSTPTLGPALARARAMDSWMRLPDRRHIAIGDSDGSAPSLARLPAPAARMAGDRVETLNSGGYTFVRSRHARQPRRWSMLAIKAGVASGGHRHRDLLSWLWSEGGCDIVVDPGKYAYDDGPLREHFVGPWAHNLVVFDGCVCDAEPRRETEHVIGSPVHRPWGVSVTARLRHAPADVEHERRYHFAPGRWLVIADRYAADRVTGFEHLTHLAPEFEASSSDGSFRVRHRSGQVLHTTAHASVPTQAAVRCGIAKPRPQGWCSRSYGRAEPCPTLEITGRARAACVVLALSLEPGGQVVEQEGRWDWICGGVELPLETGPLAGRQ